MKWLYLGVGVLALAVIAVTWLLLFVVWLLLYMRRIARDMDNM